MSLDKKLEDWEERIKEKDERPGMQSPQEQMPWTAKVERALQQKIGKGLACKACNHVNQPKSQPLLYVVRFELMREMIPMPTYVCNNCGTHFSPPEFRRIIKAALQKQEQIMKQHYEATGGEKGGD